MALFRPLTTKSHALSMNISFIVRRMSIVSGCPRLHLRDPAHQGGTLPREVAAYCPQIAPSTTGCTMWRSYAKRAKMPPPKKGRDKQPGVELSDVELHEVIDFDKMKNQMEATLEHLHKEYAEQLTLRTSVNMFDGLIVDTPDGEFPLIQIAQVVQKNPQLILINVAATPQYLPHVKTAISTSGLNVNIQQDATSLFVPVPRITREHREALAKNAKSLCDKAKEKLRNIQNNYDRDVKKAKATHSKDLIFNLHQTILSTSKSYMDKAEEVMQAKQQELLNA